MSLEVIKKNFYTPDPGSGVGPGFGTYDLYYDNVTGKVQLKQQQLIPIGTPILYEDGSYRGDATRIPELSNNGTLANTAKASQLDQQIKVAVRQAAQQQKGVLPTFAKPDNQQNPPGTNNSYPGTNPGIATLAPGGNLLSSPPGQFYDAIKKLNFKVDNESAAFGGLTIYPIDLDLSQDTFRITQYNYKAPIGEDFLSGKIDNILQGVKRGTALDGTPIGQVILPIPAGISDQNSVQWGPDNLNDLSIAAASRVNQDPFGNAIMSALTGFAANFAKIDPAAARQIAFLGTMPGFLDSPAIRPAVVSKILSSVGFEVSPETILARGFGIVPNSNMELLFQAPQLRGFSFVYKLSPRSSNEASNVRKILRFFKQGMAPRRISNSPGPGRSLFLSSPNVFRLQYKTKGDTSIKGLNKFKICALTNFSVQYAPDGWASYDDPRAPGQPVSVIMTMQFNELEPVYANDYTDNALYAPDLEPVGLDEIGY
jgi:hypothetical protein